MIGETLPATISLPYPHAGQRAVMREMRRFNWLSAGRRWRKTTLGVSVAITGIPELGMRGALDGASLIWGAPTYDQVRIAWDEMRHGVGSAADFAQVRMTAEFPTGGRVVFRSLDDPDNARGHTADGVLIDEAGDVKEAAWYEVLRPVLIDTDGWALVKGTPKGRNWFWREWMKAHDRDDSAAWQVPTKGCRIEGGRLVREPHPLENPDIPWGEIVHLFNTLPIRVFQQEILAQFLEGEGAVFRNIAANMTAPQTTPQEHSGHKIVAGVDWARLADFTAVSVGCATCKAEVARDRFNQIEYAFQRDRIAALCDKWRIATLLIELNSIGAPNLEMLQREGLPVQGFQTTPQTKLPLIQNLALSLEKEEFAFQPDNVWTGELEAYEQKINPYTSRTSYSAPEGMHDDTVIARALMLRALHQIPGRFTQSEALEQQSKWAVGRSNGKQESGANWRKF